MIKLCTQILSIAVVLGLASGQMAQGKPVFPGKTWETKTPAEVGLDSAKLDLFRDYLGGGGCVVRHGYMVYTWGDYTTPRDVASACKTVIAHFVLKAAEEKKISSLDEKVSKWEPRLNEINASLNHKDANITWKHMANQISCYGVSEAPGTAYDYNDWQMALLFDTLFLKVYGATYDNVDEKVLHPKLTDAIGCEDNPTFMAFGTKNRPGRFGVSPRDFARFGFLYLHKGNWNGKQVINKKLATMAVSSPLPNSIPRTTAKEAELIPGQRTLGSQNVPDNQTDHDGSYTWLWWVNGIDRNGRYHWPDAPKDVFGGFGHKNGQRAVVVFPSLDMVVSWNDTTLGEKKGNPRNEAFKLLLDAVKPEETPTKKNSVSREVKKQVDLSKPRVLVMTDISSLTPRKGEPDDTESLVRMLLYSNQIDIEGLVATYTNHNKTVYPEYISKIVRDYGAVRENLLKHDPNYPDEQLLLSCVKVGSEKKDAIGQNENTEGSDWIIKVVDRPDPRPVWIIIWGGPRELAQALFKAEQTKSPEEFAAFKSKIRVHAIGDQDKTAKWIRARHPDLFYITNYLTFRGMYLSGDTSLVSPQWVDENVNKGHGQLGAAYPNYAGPGPWGDDYGVKEGDTPSFFYVLPSGLSNPNEPTWGGWGGRFKGSGNRYFDAKDTIGDDTSERATVYRWRPAYQASFQARLDWCVKSYKEANHEPCAAVAGDLIRRVAPGTIVNLDASLSCDPDGDSLSYDWYWYREAGSFEGDLSIENSSNSKASFVAPKVDSPKTIHIILTVTDDGEPKLCDYRRVIVTVDPSVKVK